MRRTIASFFLLFLLPLNMLAQTTKELADIWERQHVSRILPSDVRHKDLKDYLEELKKGGLSVAEVGRSVSGKEIYQIEFGKGPLKVFLWSQMHGDEPTATSSLIDLFAVLQKNRDDPWVVKIAESMTIRAVPMLNPDGADQYIRRNLQGLDVNRDAINLKSPEARLLKKLRDDWSPHIGFNLHNQNSRTTAGESFRQAAMSFLVVYGDAAKTPSEGHERNIRLAAAMIKAIEGYIPGQIGKYDDEFTPTAFGDNFSAWGTPTILIETGGLHGRSEMFLVKLNFIAIAAALKALADGTERAFDPQVYERLPENTSGRLMDVIFRNCSILVGKAKDDPPMLADIVTGDIGVNAERRRASFPVPMIVRRIGSLTGVVGLEEYDARDFYVIGRHQPLVVGGFAEILFYRQDRQIDRGSQNLEQKYPPDAIYSVGRWVMGEGVVPKK